MAAIQWEEIRDRIRDRADQVTTQATKAFITDVQLNRRQNESFSAFHNLLVSLQRHEWALTKVLEAEGSIIAGIARYNTPLEALAIKSLRIGDGSYIEEVWPMDHAERAGLDEMNLSQAWRWGYRYRDVGGAILLSPTPDSNVTTLYFSYIGEWKELSDGQTVTVPYGWWLWPVLHCAIGMVHKRFPGEPANALMQEFNMEDARIRALAGRRSPRSLKITPARDDCPDEDLDFYGRMWPS